MNTGRLRDLPGRGAVVAICLVLGWIASVDADETPTDAVTVRGQTLHGWVRGLDGARLEFDTVYGEGTIRIPLDTVQDLEVEGEFRIYHGVDGLAEGHILGVKDGELVMGEGTRIGTLVPIAQIDVGVRRSDYDGSLATRLRGDYRGWRTELSLLSRFEQGGTEKRKLDIGVEVERRRRPTRLVLDLRYAYERQASGDDPLSTTKDEMHAAALFEYDLDQRRFLFALPAVEWDKPRNINLRTFPSAGAGYRFVERDGARLQAQAGLGWVRENFDVFGTNDYVAASFGGEVQWRFWRRWVLRAKGTYMPGISNGFGEDWLYRSEASLTVPLVDPLALRFRFSHINDDNPSPEVGDNKITSSLGLTVKF